MTCKSSKVLLDTNILIDMADTSRANHQSAMLLLNQVAKGNLSAHVSPNSLNDLYYIMVRCGHPEHEARSFVKLLIDCLEICTIDRTVCLEAIGSNEPDFEDGLVRVCAERVKASFIVSRDRAAFKQSHIKRVDAEELLQLIG